MVHVVRTIPYRVVEPEGPVSKPRPHVARCDRARRPRATRPRARQPSPLKRRYAARPEPQARGNHTELRSQQAERCSPVVRETETMLVRRESLPRAATRLPAYEIVELE